MYGDYSNRNSSSARSLNNSAHSTSSSTPTTTTRSSFEHRGSASAAPSTATPDPNDPRLRRYGQYKSERELYAQFSSQKHNSAPSASTSSYAAPAATGYAAPATSYNQYAQPAPPAAPVASTGPGPVLSTYTHPTNPSLTYKSYPAPNPATPYVPTAQPTHYSAAPVARPAPQQVPPLPLAAHGAETKEVYTQVLAFVSTRCPYANVQVFKDNCRLFGQDAMTLDAFYAYISSICTKALMKEFVPMLVRLLPTHEKREALWLQYCRDVLLLKV